MDEMTGATVVLRQGDLEALAHDPRLDGIGLTLFDMMGITDGPLRDWYGRLMFTHRGRLSPPHPVARVARVHASIRRGATRDGCGHGRHRRRLPAAQAETLSRHRRWRHG